MDVQNRIRALLTGRGLDAIGFLPIADCHVIQPEKLPESVQSAAVFLIPYYTGPHPDRNISLYAVSKDYHLFSRRLAAELTPLLKADFPDGAFYFFCDSSPINEVKAAVDTGLGVIGQNRLLISPVYGSYVFIGSLLFSSPLSSSARTAPGKCLACGACRAHCDFLAGKSDVCLSELNQRKQLTEDELALVRSRPILWGCDTCQEVCPMNKDVPLTPLSFFYEDVLESPSVEDIDGMTKEEFLSRAYSWRGRRTILRNLGKK